MARAAGAVPDARAVGDGAAAEGQPGAVGPDVDVEGRDLFRRRGASQPQRGRRARLRRLGGRRRGDAGQHQHGERPAKAPPHAAGSGRGLAPSHLSSICSHPGPLHSAATFSVARWAPRLARWRGGDRAHHDRSLSAPNSTRPSAPTVHEVMGFQ